MIHVNTGLVGIFDSGVGGLSVLREIHSLLPAQPLYYVADQQHVPFGERSLLEIRSFARGITRFLLNQGAALVTVACNTASAAALIQLREEFPQTPFVGMEPALKPAALRTKNRKVGVLATPATFQGGLFHTLVERFAQDVTLMTSTCSGLVGVIEAGEMDSPKTREILENAILPMVKSDVDMLVLGCTHFPFVLPLIQEIAGEGVVAIDPAPAVAKRVAALLDEHDLLVEEDEMEAVPIFATSGDAAGFRRSLRQLLGLDAEIQQLDWSENQVISRK
jgi:glutamate racemase